MCNLQVKKVKKLNEVIYFEIMPQIPFNKVVHYSIEWIIHLILNNI